MCKKAKSAIVARTKQCPKCPTKVALARKTCTNCDHMFYERKKLDASFDRSHMQSVASILRIRDGGHVIGYTRRMRPIKQNHFFNRQIGSDLNKSIVAGRNAKTGRNLRAETSSCVGPKVIYPDQPSPVAPVLDAMPYYGPSVRRPSLNRQKWRLPKTKSEATALIERERRFFVDLPLSLKRASDKALAEINFRLTGPTLVQQPRLYPSVM